MIRKKKPAISAGFFKYNRLKLQLAFPKGNSDVKIKVGMETVVQTVNGLRRVRITGGYWSPNKTVRWNGGRIKITQEVVMYYED